MRISYGRTPPGQDEIVKMALRAFEPLKFSDFESRVAQLEGLAHGTRLHINCVLCGMTLLVMIYRGLDDEGVFRGPDIDSLNRLLELKINEHLLYEHTLRCLARSRKRAFVGSTFTSGNTLTQSGASCCGPGLSCSASGWSNTPGLF